jgi:hypothetical protein
MQGLLFSRKKNKKYANYCHYAQYRILKVLLLIFPRVQKFQVATHQLSPVFYSLLYSLSVTNYRSTHITFQVAPNNNWIWVALLTLQVRSQASTGRSGVRGGVDPESLRMALIVGEPLTCGVCWLLQLPRLTTRCTSWRCASAMTLPTIQASRHSYSSFESPDYSP